MLMPCAVQNLLDVICYSFNCEFINYMYLRLKPLHVCIVLQVIVRASW